MTHHCSFCRNCKHLAPTVLLLKGPSWFVTLALVLTSGKNMGNVSVRDKTGLCCFPQSLCSFDLLNPLFPVPAYNANQ